jgi:hypothetical protein
MAAGLKPLAFSRRIWVRVAWLTESWTPLFIGVAVVLLDEQKDYEQENTEREDG